MRAARRLNLHLDTENPDPSGAKERNAVFCYLLALEKPFISGHFRISKELLPHIKAKYKLISILRDPVERFISDYTYGRIRLAQDGVRSPSVDIARELDDILTGDNIHFLANRFCCHLGAEQLTRDGDYNAAAELALSNLRQFDAIGFLGDIPAFEKQLRQLLDLPNLTIGHERKTENFVEPGGRTVDDYKALFAEKKTLRTIERLSAADRLFYQMALEAKDTA